MRPAQNHKRIKIILIRLIVINLFLSGIRLDRGTPVKVDRGRGISSDRGINLDRGIHWDLECRILGLFPCILSEQSAFSRVLRKYQSVTFSDSVVQMHLNLRVIQSTVALHPTNRTCNNPKNSQRKILGYPYRNPTLITSKPILNDR